MAIDPAQILRQNYASQADAVKMMELAASRAQESSAAPAAGTLMGAQVVVEADPLAELMDSMEELSFQFEEGTSKRVSERKLGQMQGARLAFELAIEKWSGMFPDLPNREFLAHVLNMARRAMGSARPMDAQDLLKELSRGSTDPSHQFAMLDILEQSLGSDETGMRELLRSAREALERSRGAEIRAGMNLAEEVNARATTSGELQNLRDLYRNEVIGFTTPQDCFRSLMATRGPGGLSAAIAFLISGCGADLRSALPSIGEEALSRILLDLQCVQVLATVYGQLDALAARMARQFGETCLMNGEQMTSRVLDFTEQSFVAPGAIAAFIGECGVRKLLSQMDFARELTKLFRSLSSRLFKKESDRIALVDSTQEHLDELINRENESEEEEGVA